MKKTLDLITIGRSSVDLYGAQIGGRLEDMGSFQKYIGGSPTNMAAGTARLGLKSALITRVGDEHMGRFIREQLVREGVDPRGIVTDPERLTALVLLGIRDQEQFPLIFYRENCADMALCEEDIDEEFIAQSRSVVATGTHLSNPRTEAAVLKALELARKHGGRTALDIDYRPNLWGLSGHGDGENRFIASDAVSAKLHGEFYLFSGIELVAEKDGKIKRNILQDAYRINLNDASRDIEKAKWEKLADMPQGMAAGPLSAAHDLKTKDILLFGGLDQQTAQYADPATHPGFLPQVLKYDTKADKWSIIGDLAKEQIRLTLPSVQDGSYYYLISGEVGPGVRTNSILAIDLKKLKSKK